MSSIGTTPSEHPQLEKTTLELLQAENASLRAELQALRADRTQPTPHSGSPVQGTFNFLGLPRELRNAIYELCVVPGRVFIKRPDHVPYLHSLDMRYPGRPPKRPNPAASPLFRINKKLRLEALEVFLSMNQFVTCASFGSQERERRTDPHPVLSRIPGHQDGDPSLLTRHLRSISISLNSIETAPNEIATKHVHITADSYDFADTTRGDDNAADEEEENFDLEEIAAHHHDLTQRLRRAFHAALRDLFTFPAPLRNIQIDVEATVCPLGCHRLVRHVFDHRSAATAGGWLAECFAARPNNALLESLDFIGTVSDEERADIRRAFPDFIREKIAFHGSYDHLAFDWRSMERVHVPFEGNWSSVSEG
jgi:hypothetical protein